MVIDHSDGLNILLSVPSMRHNYTWKGDKERMRVWKYETVTNSVKFHSFGDLENTGLLTNLIFPAKILQRLSVHSALESRALLRALVTAFVPQPLLKHLNLIQCAAEEGMSISFSSTAKFVVIVLSS